MSDPEPASSSPVIAGHSDAVGSLELSSHSPPLPASASSESAAFKRCRTRIYLLDETGPEPQWDARGTGHLTVDHVDGSARLTVISEADGQCLMNIAINLDIVYHLRQSTVITWSENGVEVGLSFEDSSGCAAVWAEVCTAQRRPVDFVPECAETSPDTREDSPGRASNSDDSNSSVDSHGSISTASVLTLPAPTQSNLSSLCEIMESTMFGNAHTLAEEVLKNGCAFLSALFSVFEDLEDLSDAPGLHKLYRVMKNVVLLNDFRIFSVLVTDKWFSQFIGVCEYETAFGAAADTEALTGTPAPLLRDDTPMPLVDDSLTLNDVVVHAVHDVPSATHAHVSHRQFISKEVHLRLPVDIADAGIVSKMHETFRLEYVRDVVFARALDDPVVGTLGHLILNNHTDMLSSLIANKSFLADLLHVVQYGKREQCDYRAGFVPPSADLSQAGSQSTVLAASQAGTPKLSQTSAPSPTDSESEDENLFIGPRVPPGFECNTQSSADSDALLSIASEPATVSGTVVGPTGLRRDALCMLQELCNTAKTIRPPLRASFVKALFDSCAGRFFDILEAVIRDASVPEPELVRAFDIIMTCMHFDVAKLRLHILSQKNVPVPPASIAATRPGPVRGPLGRPSPLVAGSELAATRSKYTFPRPAGVSQAEGSHSGLIAVEDSSPFMQLLIWRCVEDPDAGVQTQAADLLRSLLDLDGVQNPATHLSEKEDFLEMFYSSYMGWLVQPFASSKLLLQSAGTVRWESIPEVVVPIAARPSVRPVLAGPEDPIIPPRKRLCFAPTTTTDVSAGTEIGYELACDKNSKLLIIDLMCIWVRSHTYRFKYFLLRNNLCEKILRVLRYRESHMVLAGVRFLKQCIALKDEFYHRYLLKNNVFGPAMAVLARYQYANNCVNSALIDLLELIKLENIKTIIKLIVEKFGDVFRHLRYAPVFQDLINKHAQLVDFSENYDPALASREGGDGSASPVPNARTQRTAAPITELESYFDRDDDDDMEASSFSVSQPSAAAPSGQSISSNEGGVVSQLYGGLSPTRPPSPPLGSPRKSTSPPLLPLHRPSPMSPPALHSPTSPSSKFATFDIASDASASSVDSASSSKPAFVPRAQLVSSRASDDDSSFGTIALGAARGRGRGRGLVFGSRGAAVSSSASRVTVASLLASNDFVPASAASLAVTIGMSIQTSNVVKQTSSPVVVSPREDTSAPHAALPSLVNYDDDAESASGVLGTTADSDSKKRPSSAVDGIPAISAAGAVDTVDHAATHTTALAGSTGVHTDDVDTKRRKLEDSDPA